MGMGGEECVHKTEEEVEGGGRHVGTQHQPWYGTYGAPQKVAVTYSVQLLAYGNIILLSKGVRGSPMLSGAECFGGFSGCFGKIRFFR